MDPGAAAELRRLGGDPTGFRARELTPLNCEEADLILTATRMHRSAVLTETPTALRRTFTLLEFAALVTALRDDRAGAPAALVSRLSAARGTATLEDYDVPDPFGRPPEVFRHVAEVIATAVAVVAGGLATDR